MSKNGGQPQVRRILTSKSELSTFNMDLIPSVSSVLRGAEGPSQVKKLLGKSVVITRPGGHSGLSMVMHGIYWNEFNLLTQPFFIYSRPKTEFHCCHPTNKFAWSPPILGSPWPLKTYLRTRQRKR